MFNIVQSRVIPAEPEAVFDRFTDHEGWSRWAGAGKVTLIREGTPDRNGVGAVRKFVGGLQEEVTRFDRAEAMDYRIIKGVGVRDHRGEVRFEPVSGGTQVTWRVQASPTIPFTGWFLERLLNRIFARVLAALERQFK